MRFIVGILLAVLSVNVMSLDGRTEFKGVANLYARMLVSEDAETIKTGAKSIYKDSLVDEELFDLTAEILHENFADEGLRASRTDLIAWLAKVLGQSGNARYKSTITILVDSGDKKLMKYGQNALVQLRKGASASEFVVSDGVLNQMKKKYRQALAPSTSDKKSFLTINVDDSLTAIIERVGMPDELWSQDGHTVHARHFRATFSGLVLAYNNFGLVYLHHSQGSWLVSAVSNVYMLMGKDVDDDTLNVATSILGNGWKETMLLLNTKAASGKQYDERVYDIATERLYRSMDSQAAFEIKMFTYLAKFIGVGGNPKYINALEDIAKNSDSRHIRKHAKKAAKALSEVANQDKPVTQYVPGSIDIGKY